MGVLFCLRDAPLDALTDEGCHRHVMQTGVGVHTVYQRLWHTRQECPVRRPLQFAWASPWGCLVHCAVLRLPDTAWHVREQDERAGV
jgi:hypothetical protein